MDTPEVLYHYCSTETFHKIISGRSLRLSALSFSNDYLEGRLARIVIRSLCDENKLTDYQRNRIEDLLDLLENHFDSHGFCLSGAGDVLSQWRGYADNGNGVSVGFSTKYLLNLIDNNANKGNHFLSLAKVSYAPLDHRCSIQPIFDEAYKVVTDSDFNNALLKGLLSIAPDDYLQEQKKKSAQKEMELLNVMTRLLPMMFTLKTNAFYEEREWRLIEAGVTKGDPSKNYLPSKTLIIPHHYLNLEDIVGIEPISEVILGPKHQTPNSVLKGFLEKNNFKNVGIKKSIASYR